MVRVNRFGFPTHPTEEVPTTEYVVVTLGVTTILDVVALVDQAYELAEVPEFEIGAVDGICLVGPLVRVPLLVFNELSEVVRPEDSLNW